MQTDDGDLLYGVPAISAHTKLSKRVIYHLVANGRIPAFKIGEKVCWSKSGYRRWLAEQEAAARKAPPAEPSAPEVEGRRRDR